MARKYEVGDVHAPVEDVEVSLGLKLLVITMFVLLVALAVMLTIVANNMGLLEFLF